jgi:hypothetical protein
MLPSDRCQKTSFILQLADQLSCAGVRLQVDNTVKTFKGETEATERLLTDAKRYIVRSTYLLQFYHS